MLHMYEAEELHVSVYIIYTALYCISLKMSFDLPFTLNLYERKVEYSNVITFSGSLKNL